MAARPKQTRSKAEPRPTITVMRLYRSSLAEFWDLLTTREGLESWWGPEEVVTRVRRLELRPGGYLEYSLTTMNLDQVEALNKAGLPLGRVARITYTKVVPRRRLAYKTKIDFIPDVAPYEVATSVEVSAVNEGVKMVVNRDTMHDAFWTQTAALDLDRQLNRLWKLIEDRRQKESGD